MKVAFHPAAVADLNDAVAWYDRQRRGLGNTLRAEVDAAIDRIAANPISYPETQGLRRALVRRFPYSVIYRIVAQDEIRILLIRHHKRRPEYGRERR